MTNIANLIDPATLAALEGVSDLPDFSEPVINTLAVCKCERPEDAGYATLPGTTLTIHRVCGAPGPKASLMFAKHYLDAFQDDEVLRFVLATIEEAKTTEVNDLEPEPVTTINGVEYSLDSEAHVDVECADCQTPIQVEVAPKGADLDTLTEHPRVAVCTPCGKARTKGKKGVLVYVRPDVEADDLDAHFAANPDKITTHEETPVPQVDLTELSNAEFSELALKARDHMIAEKEAALPAKRKKAKKKEAKRIAKDEAMKVREREERNRVLPGFTIHKVEVPALDLSEQTSLNEAPSPKVRSPYNKALHRSGEPLLDPETTTYAVLVKTHEYLFGMKPTKEQVKAVKGKRVAAQLEPDTKAKIAAYAEVMGISEKKAGKRLQALGLV